MAMRKVRDNQTGQVFEVDDSELGNYGLSAPASQGEPTPTLQQQPSMQTQQFITGRSLEEHGQALQKARTAGDTAAVKAIKNDYDMEFEYQKEFKKEPKKTKTEEAESAINLLESIYLGEEGDQPLAFGKAGVGGRLPGVGRELQRKLAPETFPESTRLNTYKRTLESIRPQLAKAAGDAGNIALMEQIMAGKGLPDEKSTPSEAVELFKSMRGKFDLKSSERLTTFEKERLPKLKQERKQEGGLGAAVVGAGEGLFNFLLGGARDVGQDITAGITAGKMQKPAEQSIQSALAIMNLADRETDPQRKQQLLRQATDIFSAVGGQQKEIVSKFSPDVMQNPLIRGLIAGTEVATTAAGVTGLPSLLRKAPTAMGKITGAFKAKPAIFSPSSLLKGLQTAEKAKVTRTAIVEIAQQAGKKVTGTKIFKNIEEWAVRAKRANPTESKAIDKFVSGAIKQLKGKQLNPTTAKELWDDAYQGFTAAGQRGASLEASYHRVVRDALRKELDKIAPGFEKATKAIKKGLDLEDILRSIREAGQKAEIREGLKEIPSPLAEFLKGTGKKVAGGAATAGGFYLLAKMLGLDIPGMIREPQ